MAIKVTPDTGAHDVHVTTSNTCMKITRQVQAEGELDFEDIRHAVVRALPNEGAWLKGLTIQLFVKIPGGGDYSNQNLDLGEHPVQFIATWTETEDE